MREREADPVGVRHERDANRRVLEIARVLDAFINYQMPVSPSTLESLVFSLVPRARHDDTLKEDLILHCQEILNR